MKESESTHQTEPKARIFISYSRKDIAFADRLDGALRKAGFEPLIDRSEIYAFEDWWKRIEALIARADTIVFVLSPDSVASDVALKEVAHAAALNKRFAPIVLRPVESKSLPEAVARLNFIFFDNPERFEQSLAQLGEALETDIDWVRRHTELGQSAQRWDVAGRSVGLLLRSPLLEEAERWIASRPRNAPEPTTLTQEFIVASRRGASRRRNILTTSLAAGLTVSLALAALAYWQRGIAVEQTEIASQQRDTVLLQQSQFLAGLSRQQTATQHDAVAGLVLALEALPDAQASDPLARGRPYWAPAEIALEAARRELREQTLLKGHTYQVTSVAMTADGARIVTGSWDGTVRIWDADTGAELLVLKSDGEPVWSVAVTPDGTRVAAGYGTYGGSPSGTARLWDTATGSQLLVTEAQRLPVAGVALPADGRSFTTASDHGVAIRDAATGAKLRQFDVGTSQGVTSVAMTPDGRLIVAGLSGGEAQVWDRVSGAEVVTLKGHTGMVTSVAITPDGSRVVTGAAGIGQSDNSARLWDVEGGAEIARFRGHTDAIRSVAITPDGHRIATASSDRSARLWDDSGTELLVLGGHLDPIWGVAITSDASRIVTVAGTAPPSSGAGDNTARVWNARVGQGIALDVDNVAAVAVTPDGTRVIAGQGEVQHFDGPDGTMFRSAAATVLDARTGAKLFTLDGHVRSITAVAASPDSRTIVTGSADRSARVWDSGNGAELVRLEGHTDDVTSVAVMADGARVATGSKDKTARLWDLKTGAALAVLNGHGDSVTSVAGIPGPAPRLVTGSADKTARIWDLASGKELLALRGHDGAITGIAVMPDGARIVTASADGTARVWDAATGKELLVLNGHNGAVMDVAITPDGGRIMTAGEDNTVRIWDAVTGKPQAVLRGTGDAGLAGVAAMPVGKAVVIGMNDQSDALRRTHYNSTQIWPLFPTGQSLIEESKRLTPRCLSLTQRQSFDLPTTTPGWCVNKQKWPYDARSLVLDIQRLLAESNDREARARTGAALADDPSLLARLSDVWAFELTRRGYNLLFNKKVDEASSTFEEAIRWARRSADDRTALGNALVGRATALTAKREFTEALHMLQEALALGDQNAVLAIWLTRMAASRATLDSDPETALLDAVIVGLDASPELIAQLGSSTGPWSNVVMQSIGLIHGRLTISHQDEAAAVPCDELAGNPYDPLRKSIGVATVDAVRAIAACDAAVREHPGEPRYVYERGRARQLAARAATAQEETSAAETYLTAAITDLESAMAAGYPIAYFNRGLLEQFSDSRRGAPDHDQVAGALYLEGFNRILSCCWAPVARHLLAEQRLDAPTARRVVREMSAWAVALGSTASRDLLVELARDGTIAPAVPLPPAAFTDLPPWLRIKGSVPDERHD